MSHRLGMNLWASVLVLLSAGVATATVEAPQHAPPAETIPPLTLTAPAADPTTGAEAFIAASQAAHDDQVRRDAEAALAAQRAADAAAAAKRAADARAAAARAGRGAKRSADGTDVWTVLADCESGDAIVGPPYSWSNPDGTYDGPFQFSRGTWQSLGNTGEAWQQPYDVQLREAQELLARDGWGSWPSCSRRMRAAGFIP